MIHLFVSADLQKWSSDKISNNYRYLLQEVRLNSGDFFRSADLFYHLVMV